MGRQVLTREVREREIQEFGDVSGRAITLGRCRVAGRILREEEVPSPHRRANFCSRLTAFKLVTLSLKGSRAVGRAPG